MEFQIRIATINDLGAITNIYNQAIEAGNATADLSVQKPEDREEWFHAHSEDHYPIYVLLLDNEVVGWGAISPYRKGREALNTTAEISYYLHYQHHGQGLGTALIQLMMDDCKRLGIENLFSLLLDVNKPSIALLEKMGFERWGHMPNIARLRDKRCGHLIYGRNLLNPDKIY